MSGHGDSAARAPAPRASSGSSSRRRPAGSPPTARMTVPAPPARLRGSGRTRPRPPRPRPPIGRHRPASQANGRVGGCGPGRGGEGRGRASIGPLDEGRSRCPGRPRRRDEPRSPLPPAEAGAAVRGPGRSRPGRHHGEPGAGGPAAGPLGRARADLRRGLRPGRARGGQRGGRQRGATVTARDRGRCPGPGGVSGTPGAFSGAAASVRWGQLSSGLRDRGLASGDGPWPGIAGSRAAGRRRPSPPCAPRLARWRHR